jgi:glyoxylase-like metal-dependent hydrolase (beta-lactamase superfamily II)
MIEQILDDVWLLAADAEQSLPNCLLLQAGDEVVAIDSGSTPAAGRLIRAWLQEMGMPQVTRLIYTHAHWDHVFGAMAFAPDQVLAHAVTAAGIGRMQATMTTPAALSALGRNQPHLEAMVDHIHAIMESWMGFVLVEPGLLFHERLTLHLPGATLHLEHVGGAHDPGATIVRIPERKLLVLGDCFYAPAEDGITRGAHASAGDRAMVAGLLDDETELVIHGHGLPVAGAAMRAWAAGTVDALPGV